MNGAPTTLRSTEPRLAAEESPLLSRLTVRSEIPFASLDGAKNALVLFARPHLDPAKPLLLFLPAMGTAAAYYEPFARAVAASGAGVVALLDLRGQGRSSARAARLDDFGYREIVELDLPAAILELRSRHPRRPLALGGHSLGGQLAALAAARASAEMGPTARRVAGIAGLVLLAAGTAHAEAFREQQYLRTRSALAAIRLVARLLPWYPGRLLGFGGSQPRRLMRDWGRVTRRGVYRPERSEFDYEAAMGAAELPVLALEIAGDPIAPAAAISAFTAKLAKAKVTRALSTGIPSDRPWRRHFSWARSPETVLQPLLGWLDRLGRGAR